MSHNRLLSIILSSAVAYVEAGKGDIKSTNAEAQKVECEKACTEWEPFGPRYFTPEPEPKHRINHPDYGALPKRADDEKQIRGDENYIDSLKFSWFDHMSRLEDVDKETCVGRYVTSDNVGDEMTHLGKLDQVIKDMRLTADNTDIKRQRDWAFLYKPDLDELDRKEKALKEADEKRSEILSTMRSSQDRWHRGRALSNNIRLHDPVIEGKDGVWWHLQTGEKFDEGDQEVGDKEGDKEEGDKEGYEKLSPSTGTFECTLYTMTAELVVEDGEGTENGRTATVNTQVDEKSVGTFELKERASVVHAGGPDSVSGKIAETLKGDAGLEIADFSNLKKDEKEVENLTLYWGGAVDAKFYGFGGIRFQDEPEDAFQISESGDRRMECTRVEEGDGEQTGSEEKNDSDSSNDSSNNSVMLIVIIVCSACAGLALMVVINCYCACCKKSGESDDNEGEENGESDTENREDDSSLSCEEKEITFLQGEEGEPVHGVDQPVHASGYQPFVFDTPSSSHGHHEY